MFQRFLSLFLLVSFNLFAETTAPAFDTKKLKSDLSQKLAQLEGSQDGIKYEEIVFDLNKELESYVELRKKECMGEFSTIVLGPEGELVAQKKKLTKVETKLCMLELINFERRYTNVIFSLRENALKAYHKEQLRLLDDSRQKSINYLEKLANTYR